MLRHLPAGWYELFSTKCCSPGFAGRVLSMAHPETVMMSHCSGSAPLYTCASALGDWAGMQAGTLSGNPLAMTAGIKTLQILDRPGTYEYLDKITSRLINGILDAARNAGHAVCGGHISGEMPHSHVHQLLGSVLSRALMSCKPGLLPAAMLLPGLQQGGQGLPETAAWVVASCCISAGLLLLSKSARTS